MTTQMTLSGQVTATMLGLLLGLSLLGVFVVPIAGTDTASQPRQVSIVDDDGEECPDADFRTIQAAVNAAKPGATVRVCTGTYTENVVVPTQNLTIRSDDNAILNETESQSTCWSGYDGPNFTGFQISAADVTVRGFAIRNYLVSFDIQDTRNVHIQNNVVVARHGGALDRSCGTMGMDISNVTGSRIQNNDISRTNIESIHVTDSQGTVILNNTMSTSANGGIEVRRSDRTRISGNIIGPTEIGVGLREAIRVRWSNETVLQNNTLEAGDIQVGELDEPGLNGVSGSGSRIVENQVHDGAVSVNTSQAVVRDNTVGVNDPDAYRLGAVWTGIGIFAGANDSVVRDNAVTQAEGAGVYAYSADNVTIAANTVTWSRYGIQLQGNMTGEVIGNSIRRNTDGIVVCGRSGGFSPGTPGCGSSEHTRPAASVTNNDIRSNANAGILIMENSDPTKVDIHRNRFQNNGNFSIKNNASSDPNVENNDFSAGTPTTTRRGVQTTSVTEQPEPGFGLVTGVISVTLLLCLFRRNRWAQ